MWKSVSVIITISLVLVTLGIIMLASTTSVMGDAKYFSLLYKQLIFIGLGLGVAAAMAFFPYQKWKKLSVLLGAFVVVLLIMVLFPGVGIEVKGSRRWLALGGPFRFQPSEAAKIAVILICSWWMSKNQHRSDTFKHGFLIPIAVVGFFSGLILLEPDYGTTFLVAIAGAMIMFAGGTRISYLLVSGITGFAAMALLVMQDTERMRRMIAFLSPMKYAKTEAYQLMGAKTAFVAGGGTGVGLGHSLQKRSYLPEAHNDFIFAIIGEELGLGGSLGVVILFFVFFLCGLRISFLARDTFGRLVAIGITLMITIQAAINVGVVTGALPTKGLALPFISYGGSSMLVTMMMVGILVNIGSQGVDHDDSSMSYIKDKARSV